MSNPNGKSGEKFLERVRVSVSVCVREEREIEKKKKLKRDRGQARRQDRGKEGRKNG